MYLQQHVEHDLTIVLFNLKFLMQALLFVAAEDEAFMSFNRKMDARSILNERRDVPFTFDANSERNSLDAIPLAGKSISWWLNELDVIAKEVEAELVSRDIGCHLVEVLEAVNVVLFQSRGFKRHAVLVDSKFSYLHTVLSSGNGSGKASFLLHTYGSSYYTISFELLNFILLFFSIILCGLTT